MPYAKPYFFQQSLNNDYLSFVVREAA